MALARCADFFLRLLATTKENILFQSTAEAILYSAVGKVQKYPLVFKKYERIRWFLYYVEIRLPQKACSH